MWALKYRPSKFEDVIGQKSAVDILKNSVGKATTYILHGDSGVGKTTLARIFADYINGEAIEINGASNNGVDDVRNLISSASYAPAFNDYRVFIIDECHMLTTSAWNALLKILEESPRSTLWVLCTTEYAKIPQTIKSRSTIVRLAKIKNSDMTSALENIADKEKLVGAPVQDIVEASEGRLREAIVHLETYATTGQLNLPMTNRRVIELLTAVYNGEAKKSIEIIDTLRHEDVFAIIRFVNDYLRLLVIRNESPITVKTEQILIDYTSISPTLLGNLRELQSAIWNKSDGTKSQLNATIDTIYSLYDRMMRHYNDFRDGTKSISIALLKVISDSNG